MKGCQETLGPCCSTSPGDTRGQQSPLMTTFQTASYSSAVMPPLTQWELLPHLPSSFGNKLMGWRKGWQNSISPPHGQLGLLQALCLYLSHQELTSVSLVSALSISLPQLHPGTGIPCQPWKKHPTVPPSPLGMCLESQDEEEFRGMGSGFSHT